MKTWLVAALALAVTAGTVTAGAMTMGDRPLDADAGQPVQTMPAGDGGSAGGDPGLTVGGDAAVSPSPGEPTTPSATRKERAPIEQVQVISTRAYPAQHIVRVRYGLPSGCAQPGGHEVQPQGSTITINVWIQLPADPTAVCTMIYGIADLSVPLGSGLTPGAIYTVDVNGVTTSFTA